MTDSSTTTDGSEDGARTQAIETTYEIGEDEPPSRAVVRATSIATDRSVIDLDPLIEVIDPDHLDGVFDGRGEGSGHGELSVTFTFNGCNVSVEGQTIAVRAPDDEVG